MTKRRITQALLRRWPLPEPDEELGKTGRGSVVVVGGSVEVPGAAILAGVAALRAGAGRLQIATASVNATHIGIAVPEARVIALPTLRGEPSRAAIALVLERAERCDAMVIGPGLLHTAVLDEMIRRLTRRRRSAALVVDAGALAAVANGRGEAILTPHAAEAAEMLDVDVEHVRSDALGAVKQLARDLHAIVVLKGARTLVVDPDGATFENVAGNVGLGTSGSGDVLCGVIAGLRGRGAEPMQAAVWAVHAHACAGDRLARRIGAPGFLARELPAAITERIVAWSRPQ